MFFLYKKKESVTLIIIECKKNAKKEINIYIYIYIYIYILYLNLEFIFYFAPDYIN